MAEVVNYKERRENFIKTFNGDVMLTETLPKTAAELFYAEFGINFSDYSLIPIVFTVGWGEILKFVGQQPTDEFAIDICGISLEYVTEYSETDKPTNIVPQLYHKRLPVFCAKEHNIVAGAAYTDKLLQEYNSWRTANLLETVDKIERDIYSIILKEYGIDLMVSATVLPLLSAIYVAGVTIARTTGVEVNMYNIFKINIDEEDDIILTPLAMVKQYLKDDSKKIK